jgi:hypothetical protein
VRPPMKSDGGGGRSTLVTVLSHFPELEAKLELVGSGRGTDLNDDQSDALWPLVSVTSDSLHRLFLPPWLATLQMTWSSS